MNFINKFFRDEQECSVKVMEAWEVRWTSWQRSYSYADQKEQVRIFPSKEEASRFVKALEDANKLLKNSCLNVKMGKQSL